MNDEQPYRETDAWELLAKYFRHPKVLLTTLALATAVLHRIADHRRPRRRGSTGGVGGQEVA